MVYGFLNPTTPSGFERPFLPIHPFRSGQRSNFLKLATACFEAPIGKGFVGNVDALPKTAESVESMFFGALNPQGNSARQITTLPN